MDPPIDRMRARARQLRRMKDMAHDPRMIEMLRAMADDIEVDADRLEMERKERPDSA
ncbi:MAG: hypothetical protein ABI454_13100 [Sphingomicrobium sp.]